MYKPKNDGLDHINAYSKGLTELGRLLTNFAYTPFVHDKYGEFASVEGAWYFAKTGFIFNDLKSKYGYDAKKAGRKILSSLGSYNDDDVLSEHFINFIKECIRCKLRQNVDLLNMLVKSDLPIVHYYYYGDIEKEPRIVFLDKYQWQIDLIVEIREKSKVYLLNKSRDYFIKEDFEK